MVLSIYHLAVNKPSRNVGVDLVRVLGIVAVVAGHVWWQDDGVRSYVYSWHVPLFFFLAGYFWRDGRSLRHEWSARRTTLVWPYATWLVVIGAAYVSWLVLRDAVTVGSLGALVVGGAHLGRPFSAFWFISALLVVTLLLRVLQRGPVWLPWAVAGVGLVAAYLVPGLVAAVPLSAGVAVPCLVFVLAGRTARRRAVGPSARLAVGGGLVAAGTVAVTLGSGTLDLKQSDFGPTPLAVVVAIALSWGLVLVGEEIGARWSGRNAWPTTLAVGGTGVILTHAAVLWAMGTPPQGRLLDFVVATVLPWVVMLAAQRSPLSKPLLGVVRAPTRAVEAVRRG